MVNVARVRTLWLVPQASNEAAVFTVVFSMMFVVLLLESFDKSKNLRSPQEKVRSSPEQFDGLWRRIGFAWVMSTMRQGYRVLLTVDDLPTLDSRLGSKRLHEKLQIIYVKCGVQRKHSLIMACFRAYAGPFLAAVIPRLMLTGFTFAQPFMINDLINFVGDSDAPRVNAYAMIGAYGLVYLGIAASTALYWYQTFRFITCLRGGLVSLVYQHTVQGRAVDSGEIEGLTLMGTDVDRIATSLRSIHELWGSLLDISIAIYLLERQVLVACLVPAIITLRTCLALFNHRPSFYHRI